MQRHFVRAVKLEAKACLKLGEAVFGLREGRTYLKIVNKNAPKFRALCLFVTCCVF